MKIMNWYSIVKGVGNYSIPLAYLIPPVKYSKIGRKGVKTNMFRITVFKVFDKVYLHFFESIYHGQGFYELNIYPTLVFRYFSKKGIFA